MKQTSKRPALGLVARFFYIVWFILWALSFWGGLEYNDLLPQEFNAATLDLLKREWVFFAKYAAALIGGWVLIFAVLTLYSLIKESETYRSWFSLGKGGSARWSGASDFFKLRYKPSGNAPIYLGRTKHKYDPWPWCRDIGLDDENHMVTIAMSRAGKSTTVIWPNLVRYPYPYSAFILDPKGEHALHTSGRRYNQGQSVYVLDPFNVTDDKVKTHSFNPLAEIDPASGQAKEEIGKIADACIIRAASEDSTAKHFSDLQRSIISGLIAHVLTTEGSEKHNLPAVYDYFMAIGQGKDGIKKLFEAMKQNPACGNLPVEAATEYSNAGPNERGSIFTSTMTSLKWIASDAMRAHLSQSDFSLAELKTRPTTIYVVLDFDAMKPETQGRYMRVLLNLALRLSYTTSLPAHYARLGRRVLFILDEVAQLGPMPYVQDAFRSHAGANVKLWCFFQDYEALEKNYSSPSALMGNSSKQFFGCGDPDTAEAIENYLGKYLDTRSAAPGKGDGEPAFYESSKSLLDTTEIMDTIPKEYKNQLVVTSNNEKLELTREECIPTPQNPAKQRDIYSRPTSTAPDERPPLTSEEEADSRIKQYWKEYQKAKTDYEAYNQRVLKTNNDLMNHWDYLHKKRRFLDEARQDFREKNAIAAYQRRMKNTSKNHSE